MEVVFVMFFKEKVHCQYLSTGGRRFAEKVTSYNKCSLKRQTQKNIHGIMNEARLMVRICSVVLK